jgi:alkylation response protein AidB-like acyl-CoA dehydrogenase
MELTQKRKFLPRILSGEDWWRRGYSEPATPKFIADRAVQLHGGMGMSDELNIGHYLKRISAINIQFGDPARSRAALRADRGHRINQR